MDEVADCKMYTDCWVELTELEADRQGGKGECVQAEISVLFPPHLPTPNPCLLPGTAKGVGIRALGLLLVHLKWNSGPRVVKQARKPLAHFSLRSWFFDQGEGAEKRAWALYKLCLATFFNSYFFLALLWDSFAR